MEESIMKTVLVAAIALVDPDKRILLAQRPQGKAMAGLWEFPGGKIEPGELPEAALIRELHEELGIDVCRSCLSSATFVSYTYTQNPLPEEPGYGFYHIIGMLQHFCILGRRAGIGDVLSCLDDGFQLPVGLAGIILHHFAQPGFAVGNQLKDM